MRYFLMIISICFSSILLGQNEISLDDIFKNKRFTAQLIPGFNFRNDGIHYTRLEGNRINQYDLTTGKLTKVIFDANNIMVSAFSKGNVPDGKERVIEEKVPLEIKSYEFTDDESRIIIHAEKEKIYRRSSKEHAYVYNIQSQKLINVAPLGKQMYTSLSPDNDKVAYVRDNNMYFRHLDQDQETKITTDGKFNEIINGSADWVYEEEFAMSKAFEWSPDGTKIAFWRFDEKEVPEFTMLKYNDDSYPENVTFKYPKVGAKNSKVSIHIYDIKTGKTIKAQTGDSEYLPRIMWTNTADRLAVTKLNRHQNELELLLVDAKTGTSTSLLKETNRYYIDIHDHLTFVENGSQFIWLSEQDGYNHIYLYGMDGKLIRQLTKGEYDVTAFYGYDEKYKLLFYQAAEKSPMDREVYCVGLKGKKKKLLTPVAGTNKAQFSKTYDYYVVTHSTINEPPSYTVYNRKGKKVREIENNESLKRIQKECGITTTEFFDFTTSENVKLNGYMIKPPSFDSRRQYPVMMFVYGGPNSQTVLNKFGSSNYWWFQMLAQKGYVVVSVDNRGTGARGEEFRKMTHLQLGKYETMDQIEAAKYLGSLPYVDAKRIGIFGWSYGGYMSSLCMFKGADVFKTGIAVAPVTNWKWYDSVYTERYMHTEEDNPDGYKNNSPVYFADLLKGDFLLAHGLGDDNVHPQHSIELLSALITAEKHFDTYFYPNRNHSLHGDNARHHLYTKMTNFILEKL